MPLEMPYPALIVLWSLWMGQAAWACWNVARYHERTRRLTKRRSRSQRRNGLYQPPAAIIVPIKGAGPNLQEHVQALATQQYPSYRLIFVVESESDPAWAALNALSASPARDMTVLTAGQATRGGQKVFNQLRGLRELRETDEVVVFADADAVPGPQWLSMMVHPLRKEEVGATTGYRWLIPAGDPAALPSCLASVINGSVATLMGPPRRNQAWGGSMAITRRAMEQCRLAEHWQGALSDDYQLTRVVKSAGKRIVFAARCVVVSPVRHTWSTLLEFARRQYLITRVHKPHIWLAGLAITGLYTAGWSVALTAAVTRTGGWGWGLIAWAVVVALDLARARLRRLMLTDIVGPETSTHMSCVWTLERWCTPAWMALHLLIIASAAFGRRIRWAGIRYEMRGRQDVRIIGR